MKFYHTILILLNILVSSTLSAQTLEQSMDSLLRAGKQAFNGTILVAEGNKTIFTLSQGYGNLEKKTPIKHDDQFVIGSISKQITAVLLLREYEQGHLDLYKPIRAYMPELVQPWADTVTVHHLLTHTHGIKENLAMNLAPELMFSPGTRFEYSNTGYALLAEITAKVSGKSFADLSAELFKKCKMRNTYHMALKKHTRLVNGYTEDTEGKINIGFEEARIPMSFIPPGGFISTAGDLVLWNNCLHGGKILADSTYKLMTTKHKNAIREHPLFGTTYYGYGITIDGNGGLLQLGQTGKLPGFNSICFYYPKSKTSMIVLANIQYGQGNIHKDFYYQTGVQQIVRRYILHQQTLH